VLKKLQAVSLPVSLLILALACWIYWQTITRERQLVEKYESSFASLYADFGIEPPSNPETLEDLLGRSSNSWKTCRRDRRPVSGGW
jgi:hypothetical protein